MGELAKSELSAARHDPRMDRPRGGMVADFWDAVQEAERARAFAIYGLHEMAKAVEHTEQKLGVKHDDPNLNDEALRELQAAWERAAIAKAEIQNDHPQQNAHALIALNSALDGMVEEFVASVRALQTRWFSEQLVKRAEEQVPDAKHALHDRMREKLTEITEPLIAAKLPKLSRLRGSGSERYERPLRDVSLGAPKDRQIPVDLDQALTELGAIRDVFVHRAGRVDERALLQAPSLPFADGELIRLTGPLYRQYSAAIHCYGKEIIYRMMRHWPEADDEIHGPDPSKWRDYYRIGA